MLQESATRIYSDSKSARSGAKVSNSAKAKANAGRAPVSFYAGPGKRLFDLVVVVMLLPFALPLIAALLLLTSLDGGNPFFAHRRVGKNGRTFNCYKLRTMVPDAEARLQRILSEDQAAAAEWAADFKLRDDPRVTFFGRFLRKSSLDELPQLWNVVRGDMSLVGPRPVTDVEIPLYEQDVDAYYSVLPGLTGIWQVSGRNALCFSDRVALDRKYASSLSMREDLRILIMTIPAVLRVTGR